MSLPETGGLADALELADALVVRGDLDRAEEALREGLRASPESLPIREHLANLMLRTGRVAEAAPLLDELATALAKAGLPGRAIAALKKLATFDPSALPEAGHRIAALARQRAHEAAAATGADAGERRPAAGAERGVASQARRSPLFDDFSEDELAAVIDGLQLHSFGPGDLVVTQGEPGQSLFIVVSGSLKVWVREGEGRSRYVRSLGEGDFFGEVSLLTGRSRTATVTAAAPADLLELDWPRVEEIVRDHARVADVLRRFCDERLAADAAVHAAGGTGTGGA